MRNVLPTKKISPTLLSIGAALVLSACAANVDTGTVAGMTATGGEFQKSLHSEYVKLAVMENDEGDGDDAMYFIEKARKAAGGEKVGPQPIKERKLSEEGQVQLKAALDRLMAAYKGGAIEATPKLAARAQAMYDCWLQEKEEDFQPKDINACRFAFDAAYLKLGTVDAKRTPAPMPMKKMPKKMPMMDMPKPYVVYFGFDSADLDAKSMAILKTVVADAAKFKPSKVIVSGYTDSAGDAKYNMGLSRFRTANVSNTLMELGGPRKAIKRKYYGEKNQAAKTPDNQRDQGNRRVTITFER